MTVTAYKALHIAESERNGRTFVYSCSYEVSFEISCAMYSDIYFIIDRCFGNHIEKWGGEFLLRMNRTFLFGMTNTSMLNYFYSLICSSKLVEARLTPEKRLDNYRQFITWMWQLPDFRFKLPWYFSWCASKNHVGVCQNKLATILASDIIPEQEMTLEFLLSCVEKVIYRPMKVRGSNAEWQIIEALVTRRWNTTRTLWELESGFRNQRVVDLRKATKKLGAPCLCGREGK